MSRVVVVGASLAGLRAAQTFRSEGFVGDITVVGAEPHLPYDRPPLSKDFLLGRADAAQIALATEGEHTSLGAHWLLGRAATGLEPGGVRVGDDLVPADGVVIATGARARTLPFRPLGGVHTLRNLDDAVALRADLGRAVNVVVVGAGFIGTEIASAAAELGRHVTVVEPEPLPLAGKLGRTAAEILCRTVTDHGVELRCGVAVTDLQGSDRISAVVLEDGTRLPAEVVVLGVGAVPNTEWLAGSGVDTDRGVLTDEWGRTSVRHVVAAGDVARFRRGAGYTRVEHWTNARDMPGVAARTLLADLTGRPAAEPHDVVPYFWSEQFGVRIQLAGELDPDVDIEIVDGSLENRSFVAVQRDEHGIRAVLGWDLPRGFLRWRRKNEAALRHVRDSAPLATPR